MSRAGRSARGRAWWLNGIETRTAARLRELRLRELWDGTPPVPLDHVAEHLLDLSISYEEIEEEDGEEIYGSFRPEEREIVINTRHSAAYEANPGRLRFTMAHEIGHADLFALATRTDQGELGLLAGAYSPRHKSATKGEVSVVSLRLAERIRHLPAVQRAAYEQRLLAVEQKKYAAGHDTPLVRRSVDTYASLLLMPADLVRAHAAGRDLTVYAELRDLARVFVVSTTAMRHRVVDLGLVYEGPGGALQLTDPAHADQGTLF